MFSTLKACILIAALSFYQTNGESQNALNFDGNNDYVQTTYEGVLGSANRTFEAWVYASSNATTNIAITDYGTNAVGARNTFLVSGNNQLSFISGGTNANMGSGNGAVPANQWTHVAFVLNNGTGYLYVNGTQVATGNLSSVNTPSGNTDLRIGERVPGGNIPFEGAIDEVRIWDYARTAAEISNNMSSELCTLDSHLVAYHKFNHGVAGGNNSGVDESYDASGNGNTGSLTNISLTGSTSNWVIGYGLSTSSLAGTLSATGCNGSYTSPSGNYTWTQSGTYTDTVQSIMACDSVLTITLDFSTSSSASIIESACASYTSPSGLYTWTQSGTYADTIENSAGCDSVLTIDLSINNTSSEFTVEACDNYTLPSGLQTGPFSGTYLDTISNSAECDSFMIIHVTINYSTASSITEAACNSYTSPSGLFEWGISGTYVDSIQGSSGCDSVITIDLTIDTVNNGISKSGKTLSATAVGAVYQWIDCDDNSPITSALAKSYSPTETGEYAVVVTQNGCRDTSDCEKITIVGVDDYFRNAEVSLYPNPTTGLVTMDLGSEFKNAKILIIYAEGKLVQTMDNFTSEQVQISLGSVSGLCTVNVYTAAGYRSFRVVITN